MPNEIRHTPGPWAVARWDEAMDPVEQFRSHISYGSGPIWGVWCPQHPLTKGDHPNPEHAVMAALTGNGPASEVNARLIAESPDLLKALKGLLENHAGRGAPDRRVAARDFARAVIARVEGRS